MPNRSHRARSRTLSAFVAASLAASLLGVAVQTATPVPAAADQEPTVCQDSVGLINGGIEEPKVTSGRYALLDESAVPGWFTTDSQKKIEIWSGGFNGVPSAEGQQFAELNAYSASRLYQDVETAPGQTLSWSLQHRGRNGTDVMRVLIGPPDNPAQSGQNLSDGQSWGQHTGTYTVPAGQTTTRFAFEAVSSAGGNPAVGNLLDDIVFGTGPCLISDKTVQNLTSGEETAEVGDTLRYTVTTHNGGGNPAEQSIARDVLDAGLDYVPGSLRIVSGPGTGALTDAAGDDRGEYVDGDRTVRVRLGDEATADTGGDIDANTETTYTFDAVVNVDGAGTTITNEAQVLFHDAVVDEDRTSTTQTTETPVANAADLGITKTLETSPLVAGEEATYNIVVTNTGPQAAEEVALTDALPAGLSDVSATPSAGDCTVDTTRVTCAGSTLGVDETMTVAITGTVADDLAPGSALVNSAQVSSSTIDPNLADNSATASGIVTTAADIGITKEFSPAEPVAGDEVTYTLTATNTGPSEARDVLITDPLDPSAEFVSASSDVGECAFADPTVTCDIGTLAPGATAQATVTVRLDPDANAVVQNTAVVSTSTSDPADGDNTSSTSFEPTVTADLTVEKTASVDTVAAGDELTYTIVAENAGPSTAANAVLVDTLPEGIVPETATASDGTACTIDAGTVRCAWATLAPGQPVTIEVVAAVSPDAPAGDRINTASIAAPADDADTTNNSGSATVAVEQSADLAVTKTATPETGVPGTAQTFTVTVANNGPSTAQGVTIADTLPTSITGPATDDEACTVAGQALSCLLGALGPGEEASVEVTGTIAPGAVGSISNTATTSAATPDPDEGNNSSTVAIALAPSADVSVTKTTSTPNVAVDGEVTYEVTVRNDGPSTAVGVTVEDEIGEGVGLVGAEGSTGTWDTGTWLVGELAPGQVETITVFGVATAEGTSTNTVTAASETPDPDSDDLVATADVTVTATADMAITKTISDDPAPVNGEITYTISIENLGPNDASSVVVTDELPAELLDPATTDEGCEIADGTLTCSLDALANGDSAEFQVTGTIDPATGATDIDNSASVTAAEADPDTDNNTATATAAVDGTPAVELTKSAGEPVDADGDGAIGAGDTVDYTFTVTNTGDTILTDLALDDPLLGGAVTCPDFDGATLAPGDDVACGPVGHALSQGDIDAGQLVNEATVAATPPRGDATDADEATVTIVGVGAISLQKAAADPADVNGDGALGAGDTVDYTFTVSNVGTTTITEASIDDEMLGGAVTCTALDGAQIAPGDDVECEPVTYTLTQGDVDAGLVHNEAAVTGTAGGGTVTDDAALDVMIDGSTGVELLKTPGDIADTDGDGRHSAGDEIAYSFTIRNTGTTTLTVTALDDPLLGGDVGCLDDGAITIAPGDEAGCGPVTYTLTQADLDAGSVDNTATVSATGSTDVSDEGSASVDIAETTEVALEKTAGSPVDTTGDGRIGAGDTVDYTFTVTNTGTTTFTSAAVSDPLLGGDLACDDIGGLAPGDEADCGPVSYTLTQGDVDAGSVTNEASVTATSGTGESGDTAEVDVAIAGTDGVELVKTAGEPTDSTGDGRIGAGDTVEYSFAVTNTGTTSLNAAAITDDMLGGAVDCPALAETELAPGDNADCGPVSYTLTQDDIDAGSVTNTASVTAASATGDVADDADATVSITPVDAISLAKTAGEPVDADGNGRLNAGDTVAYSFTVTNTGTTTLAGIAVADEMLGGEIACPDADGTSLAPGDSVDCGPVEHTLTQGDLDRGVVHNEATASAASPNGPVTDDAQADVSIDGTEAIELTKTAGGATDTTGDGLIGAGDEIAYSFTVTNTGTVTLSDPVISDPLLGGDLACDALDDAELAPEDATGCGPYTYELTQEDVENGTVHNDAVVVADGGVGDTSDGASADVTIAGTDAVSLDKSGAAPVDTDGDGRIGAGDEVAYNFTVRNTGTTELDALGLEDPLLGGAVDCPALSDGLLPGASADCGPVAYVLTQDDVDAGTVDNTATVTGTGREPVEAADTAQVSVGGATDVSLEKTAAGPADATGDGRIGAGDEVAYSFTVTNTGTTTLTSAAVSDPLLGGDLACEALDGAEIAPGDSVDCGPVSYTLTQGDVDAGSVTNEASVTAASGTGEAEDTAEVDVAIAGTDGVELVKTAEGPTDATGDGRIGAGDEIAYSFTVTNTGTTTLSDPVVSDPLLGGEIECDAFEGAEIAPGDSVECGPVGYVLTQADVDAGAVTNTASVTAVSPEGDVADDADATVSLSAVDGISLTKGASEVVDADGDGALNAGDTIDYSLAVTNTGTTTVTGIVVTDPLLGGDVACPEAENPLAPGASVACPAVTYTITQDDIDAGTVHNEATAAGDAPSGTVEDSAAVDVTIDGSDAIELTKTAGAVTDADDDGRIGAGDEVVYSFTVTNTGTTGISDAVITDPLLGGELACDGLDGARLAPGEAVDCGPYAYALTQDDIESGTVHNDADVTADGAAGAVTDGASVDVAVAGNDALVLEKTAAAPSDATGDGRIGAGDEIAYSFAVTNTGTTVLRGVAIDDPALGGPVECAALDGMALEPGASAECGPIAYVLTQEDVDAGGVSNTATATATGAGPVADGASVRTPVEADPAIAIEKSGGAYADANGDGEITAGDTVQFRFRVTNTGTVTDTGIGIADAKLGGNLDCEVPDLAPGESFLCGPVSYAITADEAEARSVTNAATVTALAGGAVVTAEDSVTVDLLELAVTGGIITGLGWALLLLVAGILIAVAARVRRTRRG